MRRKGLIALVVVASMVGAFVGYGWWTRRAPVSFSEGGAFGSSASPAASASAATSGSASARPTTTVEPSPEPTVQANKRTTGPARVRPAGSIAPPAPGTYSYTGSGRENVKFGPASACGWDIDDVTLATKMDGDRVVMDWRWSENRQQRGIFGFDEEGMHHRFFGAVATCVGVRRTEEGTYTPPVTRVRFGLEPGARWEERSRTEQWEEHTVAQILRRERVRVPAGAFDTFVVKIRTTFSNGQSGHFEGLLWFAPALGLWVKEEAEFDIRASGADFTSSYVIELTDHPR